MIDLKYYKTVAETQNDPEILKGELRDLIFEIEKEGTEDIKTNCGGDPEKCNWANFYR